MLNSFTKEAVNWNAQFGSALRCTVGIKVNHHLSFSPDDPKNGGTLNTPICHGIADHQAFCTRDGKMIAAAIRRSRIHQNREAAVHRNVNMGGWYETNDIRREILAELAGKRAYAEIAWLLRYEKDRYPIRACQCH